MALSMWKLWCWRWCSQPTCLSASGTMITITDAITIAIITNGIITISPGRNVLTYTHNRWEAGSRSHWKIWVRDLLSPRPNCLPFLQNPRLQLSTPWPRGIVRPHRGGRAENKVETMISTDVMISATQYHQPPATRHPPPATRYLPPGAWRLPLSKSLDRALGAYMGAYSQVRLGVSCLLRVYLGACSGVCLSASWEHLESLFGSVQSSTVGVCHRVQLGASLRAWLGVYLRTYSEVYFGASWELTWECTNKQACNWEHPWEYARECTWELTQRCTWEHTWSLLGSVLRAYLGAYSQAGWECVI